jgi:hypothetical protein
MKNAAAARRLCAIARGRVGAFIAENSVLVARSPTRPVFASLRLVDLSLSGEVWRRACASEFI